MGWLGRLVPRGHLGVAIGKHWINLALVHQRADHWEVTAVRSLPAAQRDTLADVVTAMGAAGATATFSLVDKEIERKVLTLPPMAAKDLARVVAREAGLDAQRAFTWRPLRTLADGRREVEVRSLPQERVRELVREAATAGLVLTDVVPHATSFITAMIRPADAATDELLSLIEVWDHNAELVLTRSGEYVYDRHINRGLRGRHTAEPVPEAPAPPEAPHDEAPAWGEVDLASPEPASEAPPVPTPDAAPEAAVAPDWTRLAEELHRTHLFAKKNLKAGEVSRAILNGPCAGDPEFVSWLASRVGVEVIPLADYRDDVRWRAEADPRMLLSVGAALAGLAPGHARMVPAELRRRELAPPVSYAAAALLVFALLSAGMGLLYEARAVARQEADVARLKEELARAEAARAAPPVAAPLVAVDGTRHRLPRGLAGPFPGTALLDALGRAMPSRARLLQVSARWQGEAWEVVAQGEVLASPVEALKAVSTLVAALDASGRFSQVGLNPLDAGGDATPFELTLTLRGDHADPA